MSPHQTWYSRVLPLAAAVSLAASCLPTVQSGAFKVHKASLEDASAKVTERAVFELECPKEKLELVVLGATSPDIYGNQYPNQIGVTGCDHKAIYVQTNASGWVMNTESSNQKK